jgi:hypothetical protein
MNHLTGIPINLDKFDFNSILSIIRELGCSSVQSLIFSQIQIPTTLSESLLFLKQYYCKDLEEHIHESISILSSQLKDVSSEELNSFSYEILEQIFTSKSLKIPNEDYMFELISHLIEVDPNRKRLYQFVLFPSVSSRLLKQQFSSLRAEEIDSELLEALKSRLFCEIKAEEIHSQSN